MSLPYTVYLQLTTTHTYVRQREDKLSKFCAVHFVLGIPLHGTLYLHVHIILCVCTVVTQGVKLIWVLVTYIHVFVQGKLYEFIIKFYLVNPHHNA